MRPVVLPDSPAAPADVKKEGPALDLAMAVGLLRGTKFVQSDRHKEYLIAGELALDGRVRKIKGALSMALLAKARKFRGVILPEDNAREAAVVDGVEVIPVTHLSQAVSFLNEQLPLEPYELDGQPYQASQHSANLDFAEVRGQEAVKRAITVAAAGAHNLLMVGPPGTGEPEYSPPKSSGYLAGCWRELAGARQAPRRRPERRADRPGDGDSRRWPCTTSCTCCGRRG